MRTVLFKGVECQVKYLSYKGGRTRIQLINKETGNSFANATLNEESKNRKISNVFVFIKDYGDNTGMYQSLLNAKIIKPYKGKFELGLNEVLVCELNACTICDDNVHLNKVCQSCADEILKEKSID